MDQFRQPTDRPGATGAGRRIYDLLRAQIADGTLPLGTRAPSTRALAAELGVSRTTPPSPPPTNSSRPRVSLSHLPGGLPGSPALR